MSHIKNDCLEGQKIGDNNRYLLQKLLGQGGMSKVYQALDTKFEDRVVAVKIMTHYSSALNHQLITRFMREVKAISCFRHPNIIQILDFGVTPETEPFLGSPFYVMEFYEGKTLQTLLKEKKVLQIDSTLKIILQVCVGLQEAHKYNIIHRDLKPDNIFLVAGGAFGEIVKIIDFGIAKNLDTEEKQQTQVTQDGTFIGTYRYASPEQCRGLADIDQRTDIYSLGVILYESISGNNPYNLKDDNSTTRADWIACHVRVPAKPLKEQLGCENLEDDLEKIVMKCLAKSPEDRFSSVKDLETSLSNYLLEHKSNYAIKVDNARLKQVPKPTLIDSKTNNVNHDFTETFVSEEAVVTFVPGMINKDENKHLSQSKNTSNKSWLLNFSKSPKISIGVILLSSCFLLSLLYYIFAKNIINTSFNNANQNNKFNQITSTLKSQYEEKKYSDCYQLAKSNMTQEPSIIDEWLGKCGLETAKAEATLNNYEEAMNIAQEIPNRVPNYQEIQANIDSWLDAYLEEMEKKRFEKLRTIKEKAEEKKKQIRNNLDNKTTLDCTEGIFNCPQVPQPN